MPVMSEKSQSRDSGGGGGRGGDGGTGTTMRNMAAQASRAARAAKAARVAPIMKNASKAWKQGSQGSSGSGWSMNQVQAAARSWAQPQVQAARSWAAPLVEQAGVAVGEKIGPSLSSALVEASRKIEGSPQHAQGQRRWPQLVAGIAMLAAAAGSAVAAVVLKRQAEAVLGPEDQDASGPAPMGQWTDGATRSADGPFTERTYTEPASYTERVYDEPMYDERPAPPPPAPPGDYGTGPDDYLP